MFFLGFQEASVRWRGKYQDSGKYFGKIGRKFARFINGKPFNIYHDLEYKSDDTDIETCMPMKKGSSVMASILTIN